MLCKLARAWSHRALPKCYAALVGMRASYSQCGEDVVVQSILGPGYPIGRYVDIGCFHPIKWSNTYGFYLRGWNGVCVDPSTQFTESWRRFRPRDTFVNVAISDSTGQARYISYPDKPHENAIVHDFDVVQQDSDTMVDVMRLDALLDLYMQGKTIDLLSVDCEGHDLRVLQSNDFERFRPHLLVVEDHGPIAATELHQFCIDADYRLASVCLWSRIYIDNRWKRRRQSVVPAVAEMEQTPKVQGPLPVGRTAKGHR